MSVEVYLISRLEWARRLNGDFVGPAPRFKIGYSANPFERLEQLKQGTGHNLALWGVVLCADEGAAQQVERRCHTLLREHRRRGEWFECPVDTAWETIEAEYPAASTRLTHWYDIDLDTMTLVPPKLGTWQGINDDIHHYRAYKEYGVLEGRFAGLHDRPRTAQDPAGTGVPLTM